MFKGKDSFKVTVNNLRVDNTALGLIVASVNAGFLHPDGETFTGQTAASIAVVSDWLF